MIADPLMRLVRHPAAHAFWAVYPVIVTWVIVITANHWLADALPGALAAGTGAYAAHWPRAHDLGLLAVDARPHPLVVRTCMMGH